MRTEAVRELENSMPMHLINCVNFTHAGAVTKNIAQLQRVRDAQCCNSCRS